MKTYSRRRYTYVTDSAKRQLLACSSQLRLPAETLFSWAKRFSGCSKCINSFIVCDRDLYIDKSDLTMLLSYASCGCAWEHDSSPMDFRDMWRDDLGNDGTHFVSIYDLNRLCRNLYTANMMWLRQCPVLLNPNDRNSCEYCCRMWDDAYSKYPSHVSVCAFGYELLCPPVARVVLTRTPYAPSCRRVLSLRVFAKDGCGDTISWVHLLRDSVSLDAQEGQLVFLEDHLDDIDPTPIFFTYATPREADRYQLNGGEL